MIAFTIQLFFLELTKMTSWHEKNLIALSGVDTDMKTYMFYNYVSNGEVILKNSIA